MYMGNVYARFPNVDERKNHIITKRKARRATSALFIWANRRLISI